MKVVVLGAGVIGVATAYALAKAGHRVTVIEQSCGVAKETSYANGAQLSFSYTDPMATPNMLMKLPQIMRGADPSFYIEKLFASDLVRWGMSFVMNCAPHKVRSNMRSLMKLAAESSTSFQKLTQEHQFPSRKPRYGKLILAESQKSFNAGAKRTKLKREAGFNVECLSADECKQLEPHLAGWQKPIAGGFYSPDDETLDSLTFTKELARHCYEDLGVKFRLSTTVERLIIKNSRLLGVGTDQGDYTGDAAVVCMGPFAPQFLKRYDIGLNLYPLKGYSVTMPVKKNPLRVSITDLERKIVFGNLGDKIRLAGLTDFVGYDKTIVPERLDYMIDTAKSVLPDVADYDHIHNRWSGLRPTMPDGLPVIGQSKLNGLYLNVGHGMLGWTLAMGSADRLVSSLNEA